MSQIFKVTKVSYYINQYNDPNAQKEWFEHFDINGYHATRDSCRIGNADQILSVEVLTENEFQKDVNSLIENRKKNHMMVGHCAKIKENSNFPEYAGYNVILTERSGGQFSAIVLAENSSVYELNENSYENEIAWLDEEDLEIVNIDTNRNMEFVRWYEDTKDNICPDCGTYTENLYEDENVKCKKCGFSYGD